MQRRKKGEEIFSSPFDFIVVLSTAGQLNSVRLGFQPG